jgi:uncharacterized membrane protein YhaH (DUF805 family)
LRPEGVARAHVLIAHSARRSCSGHKIFRAEADDRIAKARLSRQGPPVILPQNRGAGMGFGEAVKSGFSKYFVFSGRATRPEYWYFVLFDVLSNFVGQLCDAALGTGFGRSGVFSGLVALALLIPHTAVGFRRLHDTEHSGWWVGGSLLLAIVAGVLLVVLKPVALILFLALFLVALLMLFWLCQPGSLGDNRFGPPPPTAPGALPVLE